MRGMAGVASPPRSWGHCTAGARAAEAAAAAAGSEVSASNASEGAEVDGAETEAEARESESAASSTVGRSAGGSCLTGVEAGFGTKRGGSFSPRRCHVTAAATAASSAARNITRAFGKVWSSGRDVRPWRTRRC